MPELPEVETTKRGIAPHLLSRRIIQVVVREPRLRWPVSDELAIGAKSMEVASVERRGKYLLIGGMSPAAKEQGTLIGHLGMSGSVRVLPQDAEIKKHDHVDIVLDSGQLLRFTDPRRFGSWHWQLGDALSHPLLASLGPEPLSDEFNGQLLYALSRNRKVAVKNFVMDSKVVVGVGNIYASESLFVAGILPTRPAGRVSLERYQVLADAIKKVLAASIEQGGTTLRDFTGAGGQPGYFKQRLRVYERDGEECLRCEGKVQRKVIGQRSTYFCSGCQR